MLITVGFTSEPAFIVYLIRNCVGAGVGGEAVGSVARLLVLVPTDPISD